MSFFMFHQSLSIISIIFEHPVLGLFRLFELTVPNRPEEKTPRPEGNENADDVIGPRNIGKPAEADFHLCARLFFKIFSFHLVARLPALCLFPWRKRTVSAQAQAVPDDDETARRHRPGR